MQGLTIVSKRIHQLGRVVASERNPDNVETFMKSSLADDESRFENVVPVV